MFSLQNQENCCQPQLHVYTCIAKTTRYTPIFTQVSWARQYKGVLFFNFMFPFVLFKCMNPFTWCECIKHTYLFVDKKAHYSHGNN